LPAGEGRGKNDAASGPAAGTLTVFFKYLNKSSIIILQTLCQAIFGGFMVKGWPEEADWFLRPLD
jgi:hypothetical protein